MASNFFQTVYSNTDRVGDVSQPSGLLSLVTGADTLGLRECYITDTENPTLYAPPPTGDISSRVFRDVYGFPNEGSTKYIGYNDSGTTISLSEFLAGYNTEISQDTKILAFLTGYWYANPQIIQLNGGTLNAYRGTNTAAYTLTYIDDETDEHAGYIAFTGGTGASSGFGATILYFIILG